MYNSVSKPTQPVTIPDFKLYNIWKVKATSTYKTKDQHFKENRRIVIFTTKGEGLINMTNNTFHIKEGEMLLLKADQILYYKTFENEWDFYWFEISAEQYIFNDNQLYTIYDKEQIFSNLEKCYIELSSSFSADLAIAKFCLIYLSILKENRETSLTFQEEITEKAKLYINMNINNNFKITDIASYCNISNRYLNKLFTQNEKKSPKEYALIKKFDLAKEMLHYTNMTIAEIAASVGFEDPYYFIKIFKKYVGCTPGTIRKK